MKAVGGISVRESAIADLGGGGGADWVRGSPVVTTVPVQLRTLSHASYVTSIRAHRHRAHQLTEPGFLESGKMREMGKMEGNGEK